MTQPIKKLTAAVYGKPKRGKTLGLLTAHPCALCLGTASNGLSSAEWIGLDLGSRRIQVDRLAEKPDLAHTELHVARDLILKHHTQFPAINVDDVSVMANRTMNVIKSQLKTTNKYAHADLFNQIFQSFMDAVAYAQCDILLSLHEQDPKPKMKTTKKDADPIQVGEIPCAPMLSGYVWPEQLPSLLDFVAPIVRDDSFAGWPWVYHCTAETDIIAGSRIRVPPRFPQNLGEIIRASGRSVPRPKDLAWMENLVERLAVQYIERHKEEGFDLKAWMREKSANILKVGVPKQEHVTWVLKDALDRANLRLRSANLINDFIDSLAGTTSVTNI